MYDLSGLLAQVTNVINTGLGVIDPTTPIGALVLTALGIGVIMMFLRSLKSILPRG